MANLTGSNFNALKPGLLNISTNDVPTSTGLPADGTAVFVEDGFGVKSGLKVGTELVECVEPTTRNGVVNVAFGERTYANREDLRLAITAIETYRENTNRDFSDSLTPVLERVSQLENNNNTLSGRLALAEESIDSVVNNSLTARVTGLENSYLSRLGGTLEGAVEVGGTGSFSFGGKTVNNIADAVLSNQAVSLNQMQIYVLEQIDILRQELTT